MADADQESSAGGPETIIVIRRSEGNGESSMSAAAAGEETKVEEERFSCSIDVDCGDEVGKKACCRICQLSEREEESMKTKKNVMDLIELGCGCKGDLRFAHLRCAEAWFKLRGNRFCEICGEIAKNVTRVGNANFMEEWSDGRNPGDGGRPGERSRDCRERQSFCNFLMGCLVLAFVLPWFFRLNF
ncbi:unnamed protein product [Cuscuta epithymum]|uniref:RING-CH-type domain-containing protein n=1 Tax=Cuscuta epithymum TaxID=186058 RepID=A0AAV0CQH4_9ASTE|nr:unnamed protein product [Cuscuta epithymum]